MSNQRAVISSSAVARSEEFDKMKSVAFRPCLRLILSPPLRPRAAATTPALQQRQAVRRPRASERLQEASEGLVSFKRHGVVIGSLEAAVRVIQFQTIRAHANVSLNPTRRIDSRTSLCEPPLVVPPGAKTFRLAKKYLNCYLLHCFSSDGVARFATTDIDPRSCWSSAIPYSCY